MDENMIYTGADWPYNWLFGRSHNGPSKTRYYTFQMALNIIHQTKNSPVIIETGCQRMETDIGDGASTSLFCEYLLRYGGKLISIDINPVSIQNAQNWTAHYPVDKHFVTSDSVAYLSQYTGTVDLVYLDSWDYPLDDGPELEWRQFEAQQHNLNEFMAIENRLSPNAVILMDDNLLPGGGKPKLTKQYLKDKGYICLLDYQHTIWVKQIKV
ncbi:MAG: class I SAM-dependent methyltransferase [Candidatus Pristimantibacillus sp.]